MSRADRNKHMIAARNNWAATRDGQITTKTGDVTHAFAEGFDSGRKSLMLSGGDIRITPFLQSEIDKMSGMSGIELLMHVSTDANDDYPSRKDEILHDINAELSTNYQRKHIDNWLAGRVETPKRVTQIARRNTLRYLLGDENAEKLSGLA